MSRPQVLPCDADALIQVFLSKSIKPLQTLQNRFGVQPVLVPEVEIELKSSRKFGRRISPDLTKALKSGLLRVLDRGTLAGIFSGPTGIASAAATQVAIHTLGAQYQFHVDYGEAYTHAAGITLGVPTLSHDVTALRALVNANLQVPDPVLRLFDLVVLAYQVGDLTEAECDGIRKALVAESEWIPQSFKHSSFAGGLPSFCPRILDANKTALGLATPPTAAPFVNRLLL